MNKLRYQIKVFSIEQREEMKLALLVIKRFTKKKSIPKAIIEIARQIQEKEV